jgi:DNA-binding transcriptional ArsR family regulator
MNQVDTLTPVFAALADPTRRAILASLTHGPRSVGELAKPFAMTGPAITKHLKVLEKAGLITTDRKAQWRPRSLNAASLMEAHGWIENYRRYWEESFERLDAYLEKIQQEDKT